MIPKSVVLMSGGIDSSVAARLEMDAGFQVWPLFFRYGQRHEDAEFRALERYCETRGWKHRIEVVNLGYLGGSSLTGDTPLVGSSVIVPDRNLIFCAIASNLAATIEAERVVIGCNATDHALFPDCRPEFFAQLQTTVRVVTPLIRLTKREIVAEARRLGVPLGLTWSCYAGGERPCGECGACMEREQALTEIEALEKGQG